VYGLARDLKETLLGGQPKVLLLSFSFFYFLLVCFCMIFSLLGLYMHFHVFIEA